MSRAKEQGLYGAVPVVPIPFTANEDIDEDALRGLIEFAANADLVAVCLPAYASEYYKLNDEERIRVVKIAVDQAAGRLLVIAQCNHGSARVASWLARTSVDNGANLVGVAVPRQFILRDTDLLIYLTRVLDSVSVPCLVQDFNPGGATISADFAAELYSRCPNFRYLKLEEPLVADKLNTIRLATADKVRVLEGWGGLYMMELIPVGIVGVMPGLSISDVINCVFHLRKKGLTAQAFDLYQMVLPQIIGSLQNMELFAYWDKRVLQARGLLGSAHCRSANFAPGQATLKYIEELNVRVQSAVDEILVGNQCPDLLETPSPGSDS
jgi:2-keto-3-deoxy-L-arabinonate dehydratase